jgi:hypothetical protein
MVVTVSSVERIVIVYWGNTPDGPNELLYVSESVDGTTWSDFGPFYLNYVTTYLKAPFHSPIVSGSNLFFVRTDYNDFDAIYIWDSLNQALVELYSPDFVYDTQAADTYNAALAVFGSDVAILHYDYTGTERRVSRYLDPTVGASWELKATLATGCDPGSILDGKYGLFSTNNKLYAIPWQDDTEGFRFYELNSSYIATDITSAVRPAIMEGASAGGRVQILQDATVNPSSPDIYILFSPDGSTSTVPYLFKWNGPSSPMTDYGLVTGGIASHSICGNNQPDTVGYFFFDPPEVFMAGIKSKQLDLSTNFTFTGAVSMAISSGAQVTGTPSAADDIANKSYVDSEIASLASGIDWKDAVDVLKLYGARTYAQLEAMTPGAGEAYVASSAGTLTAGSLAVVAGDIVEYSGSAWVKIVSGSGGNVPAGTRAAIATGVTLFSPLTDGTDEGKLAYWATALAPGVAPTLTTTLDGWAVLVKGEAGYYENQAYVFDGTVPTGSWVQQSAAVQIPKPATGNKRETPSTVSAVAAQDTGLDIAAGNALGGMIRIDVNGVMYDVADGDSERTTSMFYFTAGSSSPALSFANVVSGSSLYMNGNLTGFGLDSADRITMVYNAF